MICEFCEGKTTKKYVTKLHWFHGNLYVIEDVEAEVCQECGERYFHAKTLDQIEGFLQAEHPVNNNQALKLSESTNNMYEPSIFCRPFDSVWYVSGVKRQRNLYTLRCCVVSQKVISNALIRRCCFR